MVNYKDLGLVNTREMFAKAIKGGYAIPAFNFNNMEQMQAIIKAAVETKSPVILQVSKGARQYANAIICFRLLTLHSKIALTVTGILIVVGAAAFYIFEYNNPLTMQDYTVPQRIWASLFQAVTTRTAGFATIPQEDLTNTSAIISVLLMLIGGSPVGTAGGMKTVTIAVLLVSMFATIGNKEDAELFGRNIPKQAVNKSVAVVGMFFIIASLSAILLSVVTEADVIDIVYETVSATATVGLSRNLTSMLNLWGKLIIIVTMYLGRVGPISLVVAFSTQKKNKNIVKNPTEEISVG